MNQQEVQKFHKILEARVVEIARSTRWRESIAIENSADEVESVLRANDRELAVRTLEAEATTLRSSRAALRRIDEGTYGICEECEQPISPRRLAALPWASLCINCQEAADCRCGASTVRPVFALAA